jgi:hypothetical protein
MGLSRCEHGIYSPDGDGKPSKSCGLCFPTTAGTVTRWVPQDKEEWSPFPHGDNSCPECGGELIFDGENGFSCQDCGESF